jgi:adenylosuccinate lyase
MEYTAVEWLIQRLEHLIPSHYNSVIEQAKEFEKEQAKEYAVFSIMCDRKKKKVVDFKDYIKNINL